MRQRCLTWVHNIKDKDSRIISSASNTCGFDTVRLGFSSSQ